MWKPVKVDNNDYIIKKVSVGGDHKVLLSNFVNIWGEKITSASMYRRCKVKFTGYCSVTIILHKNVLHAVTLFTVFQSARRKRRRKSSSVDVSTTKRQQHRDNQYERM